MDRPFVAANDAERARLRALVARLTDEDLARPMPAGWTVAGVLAHMAYWDARAVCLIDRWEGGTPLSPADWEPENVDWINDAGKPLFLALPVRTAADLALRMAEEADRRVAALSDDLLAQVLADGLALNPTRADHRREHLDQIEQAL